MYEAEKYLPGPRENTLKLSGLETGGKLANFGVVPLVIPIIISELPSNS
jgi:hypothetical protein